MRMLGRPGRAERRSLVSRRWKARAPGKQSALADSDLPAHGFDQLRRVVADAFLEDRLHSLNIRDVFRRIAVHQHKVRNFTSLNGAHVVEHSQELSAIRSSDVDGFDGREAGFNQ